jgi:hypothetical protein
MPNSDNLPQLPKNQSAISTNGVVSRDWYRFFFNLLNKVNEGGGGNGTGTVTSVAVSGGSTGLTTSGGPITTNGTITLSGTVNVANGGTGLTSTQTNGQIDIGNGTGFTRTTLTAGSGVSITNGAGSITITATGGGGSVTAVTGTTPISSSGGTTPNISLDANYGDTLNPYASKTANYILAAPDGAAGVPTFRAVVAADIPTLNQNTTGQAGSVANALTIGTGLSGTSYNGSAAVTINNTGVTSLTGTANQVNVSASNGSVTLSLPSPINVDTTGNAGSVTNGVYTNGSYADPTWITSLAGSKITGNISGSAGNVTGVVAVLNGGTGQTSYTDGQVLIGNSTGNTLTKSTLTAGTGISITNGAGSITIDATNAGAVTSVTGTSPIVSSGGATPNISLASGYGDTQNPYASKTANYFLAAPNGTAGVPTFRAVVAADIPTLNQNTTGTADNVTGVVAIANGGTGQTTANPAFNALAPTTTKGDLIVSNGTANVRQAVGTDTYVLTADSTTATGVKWAAGGGGGSLTISNDTTTATNLYPTFAAATSGTISTIYTGDAKLLYKPSTGELTSPQVVASNGMFVNNQTISTNYTIPAGSTAISGGPITVASGIAVTVSSGARWVTV